MKYDEGLNNFHKLKDYIKTSLSIKQNLQLNPLQDDEKYENHENGNDSLSIDVKLEDNDCDVAKSRMPKSSGNNEKFFLASINSIK